jgi:hypothetical protein
MKFNAWREAALALIILLLCSCSKEVAAVDQPQAQVLPAKKTELKDMITWLDSNSSRIPVGTDGAFYWDLTDIQFDGTSIITYDLYHHNTPSPTRVPWFGQWKTGMARTVEFQHNPWCTNDDYILFTVTVIIYAPDGTSFTWTDVPMQFSQNKSYTASNPNFEWGSIPKVIKIYLKASVK